MIKIFNSTDRECMIHVNQHQADVTIEVDQEEGYALDVCFDGFDAVLEAMIKYKRRMDK